MSDAEWERQIEGGQAVVKGQGWGSGKGNWAIILGAYACIQFSNWLI